jgi:hypothetical protein
MDTQISADPISVRQWGGEFGRSLARTVKEFVAKPLHDRIAALELKIARLEATIEQRNFAYLGVWKEGKVYGPGSFVTFSGAIWHCNQHHTTTRPGDGNVGWSLAVKSGRDGRDAKNA